MYLKLKSLAALLLGGLILAASGCGSVTAKEVASGIYSIREGFVSLYVMTVTNDLYMAIDAGNSPAGVAKGLKALGISPDQVRLVYFTHSDRDHTGGATLFTNAVFFLPSQEEQMVNGTTKRVLLGMKRDNHMPVKYQPLVENLRIPVGLRKVLPLHAPGHTPGSAVYVVDEDYVFTGDLLTLSKGLAKVTPGFISMDVPRSEDTIRRLAAELTNATLVLTSHSGWGDFQKAMAGWK